MDLFVSDLVKRQKNNNIIAIKHGEKSITYSKWYIESEEISVRIRECMPLDTQNIAIFLPNSIDYAVAYFGILLVNKTIVPIGIQAKELEICSTLEYCEVDVIITTSEYEHFLSQTLRDYKYHISILFINCNRVKVIKNESSYVKKSGLPAINGNEDDVAVMLHTSGTTSNPKRVMLTHCSLINNIESNIASLELTSNDKVLIALPMFFGYCNTAQFLTHIYLGASMVIIEGMFLPKLFFETVQAEKITNFTAVPSMLLMLLEYRYYVKYDISSLRYICFGGGRMPIESLKKLILRFSTIGFVQTYGQTEASPRITALLPEYSMDKLGSVGKPIPNVKVKVVNEDGKELESNKTGEIIVSGSNIMKGYYKQEAITKTTVKDGWLYTGDLGHYDEDGFLYLTGRKKNIIISGGINIYPEEIEEILFQHPDIKDACVVGEEHKYLGEVPIAKIVLRSNSLPDLKTYCSKRLSQFKVPVRFDIFDQVEKTYNGKIKRF